MDPEIQELKELVRHNTKLLEDTNKRVHSLQRMARFSRLLSILWWVAVLAISAGAYYYYVQPYVTEIMNLYGQAQGFQGQFFDFFSRFGSSSPQ